MEFSTELADTGEDVVLGGYVFNFGQTEFEDCAESQVERARGNWRDWEFQRRGPGDSNLSCGPVQESTPASGRKPGPHGV